MTRSSNILLAHGVAIGLSALICAPARAQTSRLAPTIQPGGSVGQGGASSVIARPLSELPVTSANTALEGQSAPSISVTTRALLPGHWALHGSSYVWVPPETRLREVQTAALVQGSYVWHNGSYVWVPTHYVDP